MHDTPYDTGRAAEAIGHLEFDPFASRGPTINVAARLIDPAQAWGPVDPSSWFITHPLGTPAAGTFTEVALADDVRAELVELHAGRPEVVEMIVDEAVRHLAGQLYSDRWAQVYRPSQYADAIARHGMRRREWAVIAALEVLS
jgi:hypothetical protein